MFDRACCHWWLRLLDIRLILRGTWHLPGKGHLLGDLQLHPLFLVFF